MTFEKAKLLKKGDKVVCLRNNCRALSPHTNHRWLWAGDIIEVESVYFGPILVTVNYLVNKNGLQNFLSIDDIERAEPELPVEIPSWLE